MLNPGKSGKDSPFSLEEASPILGWSPERYSERNEKSLSSELGRGGLNFTANLCCWASRRVRTAKICGCRSNSSYSLWSGIAPSVGRTAVCLLVTTWIWVCRFFHMGGILFGIPGNGGLWFSCMGRLLGGFLVPFLKKLQFRTTGTRPLPHQANPAGSNLWASIGNNLCNYFLTTSWELYFTDY